MFSQLLYIYITLEIDPPKLGIKGRLLIKKRKLCWKKMINQLFQLQILKLVKDNYENLCIQIKALFSSQDIWNVINNGYCEYMELEEVQLTEHQRND